MLSLSHIQCKNKKKKIIQKYLKNLSWNNLVLTKYIYKIALKIIQFN